MSSFLLVFLIIFMLVFAALISAIETAITAVSPGRMQKVIKLISNKEAKIVLELIKAKDKIISILLIGYSINITICTTLATKLFIKIIGENRGIVLASIIMSILIIVLVEVIPKAIAVVKAERIVLLNLSTIVILLKLLNPINYILQLLVKAFCFTFRIKLIQEISGTDEVRGVIEHHHLEGNVYKIDRDMLGGVLNIRNMMVSEIMTHRSEVATVNIESSVQEIISFILSKPYSRVPVWKENQDNIVGTLYVRDLLEVIYEKGCVDLVKIEEVITPPWFIPDKALAVEQLISFRESNNHFAYIVNEYGELQGIITLEDIIEEIVGPIHGEYGCVSNEIVINKPGIEIIVDGTTTIREINRELNWNLPEHHSNTIAGLIIHEVEHIPEQGEVISILHFETTILKKIVNSIKKIKIVYKPPSDDN